MLISESYRAMNRQMHETMPGYGVSSQTHVGVVRWMYQTEQHTSICDYGAGKGMLKQLAPELPIAEYDPCIPGKEAAPEPADLVICTDVLEHVESQHMNAVLRDLQRVTKRKIFFTIATRVAEKTLPDGRNAHISLHGADWWRRKMRQYFKITYWDVRPGVVYGEGFPIRGKVIKIDELGNRKRRPIPHHMHGFFEHVRQHSAKYADEIHRIKTINVFEGVGDKRADMQVLASILDDVDDIDVMLRLACEACRLSVLVTMPCKPEDLPLWRNVFERRLRIIDFMHDNGLLFMNGSPMIGVQGIKAIGAVAEEDRWAQTKQHTLHFKRRIEPAPAHDKVAVLACYGPSLRDMIPSIKMAQEAGGVVISVSGAHDFLLKEGIVPTYHVECDPRAHKADNIDRAHPDVQYLIASVAHPVLFKKLEDGGADIRLWHIASAEQSPRLVDECNESSDHIIGGGGSVGLRSIPLMHAYGFRNFAVYGMDSSFRVPDDVIEKMKELMSNGTLEGEIEALKMADAVCNQWAGKHAGKRQQLCTVLCGERLFVASPILLTYATGFFETIQKMPDVHFRVYGDSLLSSMCAVYAQLPQLQPETQAAA